MNFHDFIFLKKPRYRLYRHFAFWMLRYVFLVQFICFSFFYFFNSTFSHSLFYALGTALYLLFTEVSYTYIVVYGLIPRLFKHYKIQFFLILLLLSGLLVLAEGSVYRILFELQNLPPYSFIFIWESSILVFSMSHVVCVLFIAIKYYLRYYEKVERYNDLKSENIAAEMQLLKAQIHPHFLFNTLNNIYSYTLSGSPKAGSLVLKLSDIFKYMTKDFTDTLVQLEKELKLINDYIELERVRYGKRLSFEMNMEGNADQKFIAPFLLLPFVENSFKHGASRSIDASWIKIHIKVDDDLLRMEINNSKPVQIIRETNKEGIGLKNVRRRLQLIYPQKHNLDILSGNGHYAVKLTIPLERSERGAKPERQKGFYQLFPATN